MNRVDLPMDRLIEIRDDARTRDSGKSVQRYLADWCKEFFGEVPITSFISSPIPGSSHGVITEGIAFEFYDAKNAMTFKLTWGGV